MNDELIKLIFQANPWLSNPEKLKENNELIDRTQTATLILPEWDIVWLVLTGPRQAGKTTLVKHLAIELVRQGRYETLLYLNCDLSEIRRWLTSPLFIQEALETFSLQKPVLLIDEAQRLENPGLLLKACADLKLDIKMIATGSSQLELKSKIQEFLTGRHLEARILPLSCEELPFADESRLVYGSYPAIVKSTRKIILLQQIYQDYITKDIIEILKIGKPDIMQKLIVLIAHSSGQLVNYNQLATDCQVTTPTIQHYLSILENTYILARLTPFVGNKRKEITSNPVFYFIDNGFRNQALRNLSTALDTRYDAGLLVQSAVFQELLKFKYGYFYDFNIHFWRTQSGAEVDFVIYKNSECIIPIEVKYQKMSGCTLSRSFRSFVEAYKPKNGFYVTKNFNGKIKLGSCEIYFISFENFPQLLGHLKKML